MFFNAGLKALKKFNLFWKPHILYVARFKRHRVITNTGRIGILLTEVMSRWSCAERLFLTNHGCYLRVITLAQKNSRFYMAEFNKDNL